MRPLDFLGLGLSAAWPGGDEQDQGARHAADELQRPHMATHEHAPKGLDKRLSGSLYHSFNADRRPSHYSTLARVGSSPNASSGEFTVKTPFRNGDLRFFPFAKRREARILSPLYSKEGGVEQVSCRNGMPEYPEHVENVLHNGRCEDDARVPCPPHFGRAWKATCESMTAEASVTTSDPCARGLRESRPTRSPAEAPGLEKGGPEKGDATLRPLLRPTRERGGIGLWTRAKFTTMLFH